MLWIISHTVYWQSLYSLSSHFDFYSTQVVLKFQNDVNAEAEITEQRDK